MDDGSSGGCSWIMARFGVFLAAIWVGSSLGVAALGAGMAAGGVRFSAGDIWVLLIGPAFLFTTWGVINAMILFGWLWTYVRSDSMSVGSLGALAGLESLFVMLGWVEELRGAWGVAVGWGTWIVLLAMLSTALWFVRQWWLNRWAGELAILHAENAARRAALDDHKAQKDGESRSQDG